MAKDKSSFISNDMNHTSINIKIRPSLITSVLLTVSTAIELTSKGWARALFRRKAPYLDPCVVSNNQAFSHILVNEVKGVSPGW